MCEKFFVELRLDSVCVLISVFDLACGLGSVWRVL